MKTDHRQTIDPEWDGEVSVSLLTVIAEAGADAKGL